MRLANLINNDLSQPSAGREAQKTAFPTAAALDRLKL